jgi:hypothetical protein
MRAHSLSTRPQLAPVLNEHIDVVIIVMVKEKTSTDTQQVNLGGESNTFERRELRGDVAGEFDVGHGDN